MIAGAAPGGELALMLSELGEWRYGARHCHQRHASVIHPDFPKLRCGCGPVAQRLEPTAHNGLVGGSIPSRPTNFSQALPPERRYFCFGFTPELRRSFRAAFFIGASLRL